MSINKRIKDIYTDTELVLPMYNMHPYFSLKNLGKKNAHYTWQNTVHVGGATAARHLCERAFLAQQAALLYPGWQVQKGQSCTILLRNQPSGLGKGETMTCSTQITTYPTQNFPDASAKHNASRAPGNTQLGDTVEKVFICVRTLWGPR